jgi:hypothetical protein
MGAMPFITMGKSIAGMARSYRILSAGIVALHAGYKV